MTLTFRVDGLPAPQGSKAYKGMRKSKATGKEVPVLVESSAKVGPWRAAVEAAARQAAVAQRWTRIDGAASVGLTFYLPRPKGHYGTGRNAGQLRPTAPAYPATRPDGDKLTRSTFDALTTAGVWADDSQAVDLFVTKRYADPLNPPGCIVSLRPKE